MTEELLPKLTQIDDLFEGQVRGWLAERIGNPLTNWGFFPPEMARDIRRYDWHQYTNVVYDNDTVINEELMDICQMILFRALDHQGKNLSRIFKIRVVNSLPGDRGNSQPHIDITGPHQTGIYFPMDSDGTTDILRERSWMQDWELPQNLENIVHRLEPRGGTWYDFDGTHWRWTGRPQEHQQRICVIFNYTTTRV